MEFAKKVYPEVVKRNLKLGVSFLFYTRNGADEQTTTCCYYATIHEESSKLLADTCLEQGESFLTECVV
jgi:guanine deaminase